jgi:hypothetical protein
MVFRYLHSHHIIGEEFKIEKEKTPGVKVLVRRYPEEKLGSWYWTGRY